jgi:hypothetical protein
VLAMKDGKSGDVSEVTLFGFASYEAKTYQVNPDTGTAEFQGEALDQFAVESNLTTGMVSLAPSSVSFGDGSTSVEASIDVSFARGLAVRGAGTVPVHEVAAP